MTFTWVDGPFGGTPVTAANMNAAMGVSDAAVATAVGGGPLTGAQLDSAFAGKITTPGTATATALNATYVNKPSGIADGQVAVWNAATSAWVAATPTTAGVSAALSIVFGG